MPQSNTNTKRGDIQHIRSVEYSTARYRFFQERFPLKGEAPLVFRIQVGLWCKITTGHKLDRDVSISQSPLRHINIQWRCHCPTHILLTVHSR
jgi:hypothetical protein